MSRHSSTPITKPVVVLRKRTRPKSVVPSPTAKPTVANPPQVATATRATPTLSSLPVASPLSGQRSTPAPKPSPPPEDPAVVAARRAKRSAAIQAVLKEIMDRWPQTFSPHPQPVRPLATGIGQAIAAQLPEVSKKLVHQAIARWQQQRQTMYWQAVSAGGPRYDLDGKAQGEVTPEHQHRAQEQLVARRTARQEQQRTGSPCSRPASAREGRERGNPQDGPQATG